MHVLLVHNPTAGEGEHSKDELIDRLHAAGLEVSYCSTKSPDFSEKCRQAADIIAIAGGDGTVRKTTTKLRDPRTPILILPLGTANNVARSLRIPSEIANISDYLRTAKHRRFDIGMASGPWGTKPFIEAVGCGALAATTAGKPGKDTDRRERLLTGRRAFFDELKAAAPFEASIKVDGIEGTGKWLAIEVLNHSYSGSRLFLAPDADSGDGKLDLLCIAEEQRSEMLDWLVAPETLEPPIQTARCRRVSFEWDGQQPLRLDDRTQHAMGKQKPHKISLRLKKPGLTVLVPAADTKARRDERSVGFPES